MQGKANSIHGYAQTNIQLYKQLIESQYAHEDLVMIRRAYDLAVQLFTCRFQKSGKPSIDHGVGTASILASLSVDPHLVAAGLLHNAYQNGDFGHYRKRMTESKRSVIKREVGREVESYVAGFNTIAWNADSVSYFSQSVRNRSELDRGVILLHLAEYLEQALDNALSYWNSEHRNTMLENCIAFEKLASLAERLGYSQLGDELLNAMKDNGLTSRWPNLEWRKRTGSKWKIVTKSYRRKMSIRVVSRIVKYLRARFNFPVLNRIR